jgi:RNA polymerase-binding transcription factor DksA
MKKTTAKKQSSKTSKAPVSPRKTKKAFVSKAEKKVAKPAKKTTKKKASALAAKTSKSPAKVKTVKTSRVKTSPKTKAKIKPIKSEKKTKLIKEIRTQQAKKGVKFSKSELTRLKDELHAERTRVIKELDNLDDITHTNGNVDDIVEVHAYSIHMAENASDIEAVNTALGLRKILIERLTQINHALERLNEGSYGICLRCGCAINMERLLAKPQATLCVNCRRIVEAEKRGVI